MVEINKKNELVISDDKLKLDIPLIFNFITNSYWAKGRSLEDVKTSIDNSICFGIYIGGKQVGFARVITDFVVFAYLMDVFIIEKERSKGYSKMLLNHIFSDDRFKKIKKWMLATADAHLLYEKYGFRIIASPGKFMEMIPQVQ